MNAEAAILPLVRPAVLALKAYTSARSLGVSGILLDANESPWPLDESDDFDGVNRYPTPQPPGLVAAASRIYGVAEASILVSRGSDEGIDLLVRALCEAGQDQILTCPPTYGVYATAAAIQGCGVVCVPLKTPGFKLDTAGIIDAVARSKNGPIKLVFIGSPNNPTGTTSPAADMSKLCRALEGKAVVVVDEAYQEFAKTPSMARRLRKLPNLAVLRTLSKAWGLAGARCGFTLAHPALIAVLQKIRAPYPMSSASAKLAQSVFHVKGRAKMRASVKKLINERKRLAAALSKYGEVFPSDANFFLIRVKNPQNAMRAAAQAGILLRDRSKEPGLDCCIRVTVGTTAENNRLIAAFEGI